MEKVKIWQKVGGMMRGIVVLAMMILGVGAGSLMMSGSVMTETVWAAPDPGKEDPKKEPEGGGGGKCGKDQIETATFGCVDDDKKGGPVFMLLNIVLTVLTFGIGALATVGIIVAGIQYATAKDDAGQVAKAKRRIVEIVIGLVAYAMLYAMLNWLIPGGIGG